MENTVLLKLNDEKRVNDADERVKADLAALDPKALIAVNLDVAAAVGTVLGVLPEVTALREQIVSELPKFDIASFDKLEDYAVALYSANTDYITATQPPDDLKELTAEATKLRDRLAQDARALANNNLVDGGQIAQVKTGVGYKNLAQDLGILSRVLKTAWPNIQGKTAVTAESIDVASRMALRLTRIVGLREQGPAVVAAAADHRLRAFTQLLNTYEAARRAVIYLRGELDDADDIAPSLYPGRPRRRREDDAEVTADEGTGTGSGSGTIPPAAPPGAPTGTGAGGAGTAPAAGTDVGKNGPFMS